MKKNLLESEAAFIDEVVEYTQETERQMFEPKEVKEWQVSKTVNDYTVHDGEKDIALVYQYSRGTAEDEAERNARMVAGSPEMLAALNRVISEVPLNGENHWEDTSQARQMLDLKRDIERLIYKIENK